MKRFAILLLQFCWFLTPVLPLQAAELIMFDQTGCPWCERWEEEIGVIYDKTAEGKRAPLRRVNIHKEMPDDLADLKSGRFTPTFVLIEDGKEIGRIRGYPGEDFFWGLLGQMIDKLPPKQDGQQQKNG